jgi:ribosomal protein L40E
MFWDCRNCHTHKLLGKTHRHCPVCGLPQKAATRYFPKDHEKVEVHDHLYFGTDIVCSRCETQNSAAAQHCFHCGFGLVGMAAVVELKPSELSSSSKPSPSTSTLETPLIRKRRSDSRGAVQDTPVATTPSISRYSCTYSARHVQYF